jgi:hypothetical protein
VPEADILALLDWAHSTRTGNALLDNLLEGSVYVRMKEGDSEPSFQLSPRGMKSAKRTARDAGLPVADDDPPAATP